MDSEKFGTYILVWSQKKIAGADIRVTHREGRLKGAISAHRLSLERFLSDGKIRSPMGGIQNVWDRTKAQNNKTRRALWDGLLLRCLCSQGKDVKALAAALKRRRRNYQTGLIGLL